MSPLKPRTIPVYIPQECQVHTCKSEAVAYCARMYVFVCDFHRAEFCLKDNPAHQLLDIREGLQECINEMESGIKANISAIRSYRRRLSAYKGKLKRLSQGEFQ